MIAFLDSSALIYYFEGAQHYRQAVIEVLQAIKAKEASAKVAVSRLGIMECRVKPLREANAVLLGQYDEFFAQVQVVELTAQVLEIATQLRATTALKTPDCLQAACAISLSPDCSFVTVDVGFARVLGLRMNLVGVATGSE